MKDEHYHYSIFYTYDKGYGRGRMLTVSGAYPLSQSDMIQLDKKVCSETGYSDAFVGAATLIKCDCEENNEKN